MRNETGQALSEYSVFVAIVLIALLAINVYVKRGLQGKYADVMDSTIAAVRRNPAALNAYSQYEPYYESSNTLVYAPKHTSEEIAISHDLTRTFSEDDITTVDTSSVEGINVENSTVIW